ncbi:Hypothetical protein R9X50_00309400 [Acrodontium crateriforme]|uniref:Enoyl reductase (ER) domain-containing protein n=1 Tax=Acrodontium crateriforme TaxID=150365 RepID=A0AAQ3R9M0_9PEZI|nr:Hypothetical protein R9X50_00309400 [Acrodontium crateriforme]
MPTQIRKAVISAFGDESNITIVNATIDDPTKDEVQVRVFYSSFSGTDVNMRLGRYPMQRAAPLTPGYCLVGAVEKDSSSGNFKRGDVVGALTIYDGQATLCNVPEKYLVLLPSGLDHRKACALIVDWTTAYGLVMRSGKVSAGQRVFIHGLSGAVGYASAFLCQLQGVRVYGTASERNHVMLKTLGWTPYVYSNKNWIQSMKEIGGADIVFDPLGFESWDESWSILSKNHSILIGYGGNLATLNNQPSRSVVMPTIKLLSRNIMCLGFGNKTTKFYYISRDDKTFIPDLQALFELLQQDRIDVRIKSVFDLEDVQVAHRCWSNSALGAGVGSMLFNVGAK